MAIIADIIAVGTELLLGEVTNTNAAWLSQELSALGVHVYYHHTVGDNPQRIHHLLDGILSRQQDPPDVLLFSGGLGPTPDDLTVQTLADYFGATLVHDAESEKHIRRVFLKRGIQHVTHNNLKQALRPEQAEVVENPLGTAPGIWWTTPKGVTLATFPGVPQELKMMWPEVQQRLLALMHKANPTQLKPDKLFCRYMHFFGVGESFLAERVQDLLQQTHPTVAPYVDKAHVKLRLACMASTEAEAAKHLDPLEDTISQRLAEFYLTTTTQPLQLEFWVADMLKALQLTVAVAESCTGGLISHRLTNVPGSSSYTVLNMVTYSNLVKSSELQVPPDVLLSHGAVSAPVALALARGVRKKAKAHYGLGITGVAGPDGGSENKPVGLAYIAISGPHNQEMVQEIRVSARYSREDVKFAFSQYALVHLARQLQQQAQLTMMVARH
jgi:nicotinamide-nucleotide amidase